VNPGGRGSLLIVSCRSLVVGRRSWVVDCVGRGRRVSLVVGRWSWAVGRGSWVVGGRSWVVGRGSWAVVGRRSSTRSSVISCRSWVVGRQRGLRSSVVGCVGRGRESWSWVVGRGS